jgi:uncharacterized protein YutE (UPF0331/DUF86 family)
MVNRLLLERILGDIRYNARLLQEADDIDWANYQQDPRSRRFVERTLHIIIEACIDLAQHVISDQSLREPSSYRDSFVVLAENGIIQRDTLPVLERMAAFRNLIVHYYDRVEDEIVFGIFKHRLSDFELFVNDILRWLQKEDGEGVTKE